MVYWGDLHNHCAITYGFGSLENALKTARSHLDFCSVTGHGMWHDIYDDDPEIEFLIAFHKSGFEKLRQNWDYVKSTIAEYNSDDLITFQSYEMHSRKYGDYHIVSPDDALSLIYRDSPKKLVDECGVKAIAIPHHIGYTPGYRGINWDNFIEEISPCIEVISKHGCAMSITSPHPYYHTMGPRDPRNTIYEGMKQKKRFSFVGSTDHHAGFPGSYGDGLTAVIAKEKTIQAIWDALKAGRTYAVSGDRIMCDFRINGEPLGSTIHGDKRYITLNVQGEYWLDKLIIYKNLVPIHVQNFENIKKRPTSRYKLRVEAGWGRNTELYQWDCSVKVDGGRIINANPYFRGRSILAPNKENKDTNNDVNDFNNYIKEKSDKVFSWVCETVKNTTTLHPQTDSAVIEIEGTPDTKVTISVNSHVNTKTIKELLDYGYSRHMKYYFSNAYLVHTLIPQYAYDIEIEIEDKSENSEFDIYHAEVFQKNGQSAYISPIYAN